MMQSMEDYINGVYKKYEESEKKHEVYKTVKVKYHNPLTTLCSVAACLILVCICIIGINKYKVDDEIKYGATEKEVEITNDGKRVYTSIINIDRMTNLERLINSSDCIAIVSDFNVVDIQCEIRKEYLHLKTIGTIYIDTIKKGDNCLSINYSKIGGLMSLDKMKDKLKVDFDTLKKMIVDDDLLVEEISNSYFKQVPSKGTDFEKGKQYLVFLDYNEENDIYEITDLAYGIMEYDPVTNMVKNIDTGEFEEFDWSLIEQE